MRGVVTVAAAQSLPDDTPYRPQLVLIAFVVAATTLLVQGLTLPRVIRVLKISGDDPAADRAEYRQLVTDLSGTARAVLDDPDLCRPDGSPYPAAVLDRARRDALVHGSSTVPHAAGDAARDTEGDVGEDADPREQYRQLMLQLLAAERARLLAARSAGAYTSRTLTRAQRSMDLMEATLQQIPDLTDQGG
jgi:CPA1 family monovalent cation:H+ antiporter